MRVDVKEPDQILDLQADLGRRRRILQIALGGIWLIDAALQYQPYMFTKDFVTQLLVPTAAGNPWIFYRPMIWADNFMVHDIVLWNILYATIQLLIAVGLFWRPTVRLALGGSVVWSLAVWWFAEGFGGIFSGGATPYMGGPGAVILYALLAILLWPRDSEGSVCSVARSSPLGRYAPGVLWAVLWGSFAYYVLLPINRGAQDLHDMIAAMASGEPGWIQSMDHGIATLVDHRGTEFSVVTAALCVAIALAVFVPSLIRPALAVVLVLSVAVWLVEDFGGIFTLQGTDVNSGPLLALLALTYWPVARALPRQARGAVEDERVGALGRR